MEAGLEQLCSAGRATLQEQWINVWFVLGELAPEVDDERYTAVRQAYALAHGRIAESYTSVPGQTVPAEGAGDYPVPAYELCEECLELEVRDEKMAWCVSYSTGRLLAPEVVARLRDHCVAVMVAACAESGVTCRYVETTAYQCFRVTREHRLEVPPAA